jgi:ATP-dependent Clp protease adaptor protein ClpS
MEINLSNTSLNVDKKIVPKIMEPGLFKVIIVNDDVTPVEFVVALLVTLFGYDQDRATNLTYKIHHDGNAVAGIYSYEIAEQKAIESTEMSRAHGFPLQIKVQSE